MKKITFKPLSETGGYCILKDEEYRRYLEKARNAAEEGHCYDYSYCADGDDFYVDTSISGKDILSAFEDTEEISESEYKILEKHGCECGGNMDISGLLEWLDDNFETEAEKKERLAEEEKERQEEKRKKDKERTDRGNLRYFSESTVKRYFPNGLCDFDEGDRHYCAIFRTQLLKAGDIENTGKVGNMIQRTPIFHVKENENPEDVAKSHFGFYYRSAKSVKDITEKYQCEFSHSLLKVVEVGADSREKFKKTMESLELIVKDLEMSSLERKSDKIEDKIDMSRVRRVLPSFESKTCEAKYLVPIGEKVCLVDYWCDDFDRIDSEFLERMSDDYRISNRMLYNTYFTDLSDESKSLIRFDIYSRMVFHEEFEELDCMPNLNMSLCGLTVNYDGEWYVKDGKIHFTTGHDRSQYLYRKVCGEETLSKMSEVEKREMALTEEFEDRREEMLKKLTDEYNEKMLRLEDEYFSA